MKHLKDIKSEHSNLIAIFTIVFITAFLGELKIIAFSSSFRFGLGSAAFFFLLLFYKEVSYLLIGVLAGVFITSFRIGIDYLQIENFDIFNSLATHGPILGYYIIFALILYLGRASYLFEYPLYLGLLGAFSDGTANIVELIIRSFLISNNLITLDNIKYVVIIAILRSFFVVGLFNMTFTKQMKAIYHEQKRRLEQIQLISSGLYVEAFYLKKLMKEIENVTAKSFELYRKLKEYDEIPQNISQSALSIAQEVHETKKDNQRVLAGLEKIIEQETVLNQTSLTEIFELIIRANRKYSALLKKDIEFKYEVNVNIQINKVYLLVAIINNLVANAVEAIEGKGKISLLAYEERNFLKIRITDNGTGILPGDEEIIFEPGFTTKFDEAGKQSTGIGLSHVKSMILKFGGNIKIISKSSDTIFILELPIDSLN